MEKARSQFHTITVPLREAPVGFLTRRLLIPAPLLSAEWCFILKQMALFFCLKLDGRADGAVDSREKLLEFCFDYCYWSVDAADARYASQEEVTASPANH